MKILLYSLSLFVVVISSFDVWALAVDEKLTLRIVKTSQSRKTILINRGIEDGLVKGDHAKFFLTVGVVARAVMIKGSPTRSVWSIYRLVNADYIKNNQVMNLKITPAVKITKDESRMIVKDDTAKTTDPRDLGIPLASGADDLSEQDKQLLNDSPSVSLGMSQDINDKNREIFFTLFMGQFSSTTTPSSGNAFTNSESTTMLNFGYEYYFKDRAKWYSQFSLLGQIAITQNSVMAHEGTNAADSSTEFGGGINWYLMGPPDMSGKFIWYAATSFMMGNSTTTMNPGANSLASSEQLNASVVSYTLGAGVKFYTSEGFGARMQLDYYARGDSFANDRFNVSWVKNKVGPRVTMGLSYRF